MQCFGTGLYTKGVGLTLNKVCPLFHRIARFRIKGDDGGRGDVRVLEQIIRTLSPQQLGCGSVGGDPEKTLHSLAITVVVVPEQNMTVGVMVSH